METANIEMRTCKTCGETKPLEEGFYKTGSAYSHKVHYRHICKHCVSETINKKGKERRKEAENEAIGMRTCKTCAAQAACPILSFSLWTGDTPQRLGAW